MFIDNEDDIDFRFVNLCDFVVDAREVVALFDVEVVNFRAIRFDLGDVENPISLKIQNVINLV